MPVLPSPPSQLCVWPVAECCLLQWSPCCPWFWQMPHSQEPLRGSNLYFVEFSLQSFRGRRASFEGGEGVVCHGFVSSFGVLLSGCSSDGLCGDVQVLKEAGMIMRRSTWDFARDETTCGSDEEYSHYSEQIRGNVVRLPQW